MGWKHFNIKFHRNIKRLRRFVLPSRCTSAAAIFGIVGDVFRGEQSKTHGETTVNLAQVDQWIERISAIKDNIAGEHREFPGENIEFDLTGAGTERVVPDENQETIVELKNCF